MLQCIRVRYARAACKRRMQNTSALCHSTLFEYVLQSRTLYAHGFRASLRGNGRVSSSPTKYCNIYLIATRLSHSQGCLCHISRWSTKAVYYKVVFDMAKSITLDDIPAQFKSDSEFRYPSASVPHIVLEPELVTDKQVFVIGDVHGCYDELKLLLDKVQISIGNPNVITILVGDLVNKGSQNRQVLDLVRRLGAYSVRGNHDQKCISQMTFLREGKPIEDEFEWIRNLTEEDYQQLMELPYTISLPSLQSIVVHACLVPGIPIASQDIVDMMIMRNLIQLGTDCQTESSSHGFHQRYKASKLRSCGEPWASLWPGPNHIYFGHDAVRGLQQYKYATGLDTGCVYGKHLTGVFLTGNKKLVQVEAKKMYSKPDYVLQ